MAVSLRAILIPGLAVALAATMAGACGSRGPLETIVIEKIYVEASVDSSVADVARDVTVDAPTDAGAEASDGGTEAESDAEGDAGCLATCATCLTQNCGSDIVTCVTDPGCVKALQCAVQTCVTGGAPNLQCFGTCTGGDASTQEQVLGTIGCVLGNCPCCMTVLGAIGSSSGGAGGAGG